MDIIGKLKKKLDFACKLNDLFGRKERMQFVGVIAVALAMAVFQAIGVAAILPFINMVMNPDIIMENQRLNYLYTFLNFDSATSFLIFSGFAVLGMLVVGNLISAFSIWLRIRFVWRENHRLASALLNKYLSMPYAYFLNQNTAELEKNILSEAQQMTNGFLMSLISLITNLIITIVILALLLYVNMYITLVVVTVLAGLYLLIFLYFSGKLKSGGERRLHENRERFKSAKEALSGVKDIKILGVEGFFSSKFSNHSNNFSLLQSWNQVIGQIPRYLMEIIAFGGIIGFLIFAISSRMSIQKFIPLVSFFALAGYRLIPALQGVFNSFTSLKFDSAILNKIHHDMVDLRSVGNGNFLKKKEIKPMSFKEKIELKNICFAYPGSHNQTLKDINLEIKKNSFVALIGSTGSGKTTLVDLILGLLAPTKGKIRIDDVQIDDNNLRNWQANLGYVPQQIYLTDDTIARNIAFGVPDEKIDMEKIKKAAKMANIHGFIDEELLKGYDTVIGERGVRISGGQRQRIGIARALYHDPDVLIFDEATSALDNKTEDEVLEAINNVAKFKTMIVIAHRLSTVKNSDVVHLIEKGMIIDKGSYERMAGKKESDKIKKIYSENK